MTTTLKCYAAVFAVLLASSPVHAGPCAQTIAGLQAQVDEAIEAQAGYDGWKPESLNALRGDQPTPRSLANAEGSNGARFEYALNSLARARAADRAADSATCHRALANARSALRQ